MSPKVAESPTPYEVERGKPMPSFNHGFIQANLIYEFKKHGTHSVLSELKLEMQELPNLVPDISIVPMQKLDLHHDQIRYPEPPLMTVEILSPTQGDYMVIQNAHRYLEFGVKSCWIVHPTAHTIQIIEPEGKSAVFSEGVITDPATGLTVDLAAVFS
ncbi:MAG: Uma2 family endonuclease [Verrucomicrobiota bacterium]